jgi:hypothetical protein
MGYATKNLFGAFAYTFESLKVEDDIRNLRVGISTDSDLVLKGVKGEIDYRFEAPTAALDSAQMGAAKESAAIDQYYTQIGTGRVTKTASNLAPLESYSVTGAYAKNRLFLYAKEVVSIVAALIIVFVISLVIIRKVLKKLKQDNQDGQEDKSSAMGSTGQMLLITSGVGFLSSVLIAGYTLATLAVGTFLTQAVSYRFNTIIVLFLVIISLFVYMLLLLAPAVYLGIKKGVGWGIVSAVSTIIWLFIYMVVAIFVILLIGTGSRSPVFSLLEGI